MRGIACGLVLSLLPAQEVPREGIFGEVRTVDAKAWSVAMVTLVHIAHPGLTDARFVDRVVATTDERGRFRAQLLAGMSYVAWASSPVVDGMYRCTAVAAGVVSGVPVLLQEGDVHRQRQVRLELDASWQGNVRLVATAWLRPFTLREELSLVDGLATLPPWPETNVGVQVELDEASVFGGSTATTFAAQLASRRRPAAEKSEPAPSEDVVQREFTAPHVLTVGPRATHAIRLVDAENKPVRGARVVEESREPRRLLGTSDADGIVRFAHVADGSVPHRALVFAEGCAETAVEEEDWVVGDATPKAKVLAAGVTVRGRLLDGDGVPAAGQPLLLEGSISTGPNSTYFGVDRRLFVAAADGAIAVHGRTSTHSWYLATVLTPQQRARFAATTKSPVAAVALLVPPTNAAPAMLGDVRLDRLRAIDLRVIGSDGGPPGPVDIVMIPSPSAHLQNAPHEPLRARTDRLGRLRVLASDGITFAVWAMSSAGATWCTVKVGDPEETLRLDARHVLSLRLVDHDQKPLAGLLAHVVVPEGVPEGDGAAALMPRVHDAFMVHGFPFKQARTDEQGLVQLVMPFAGVGIDVVFYRDRQQTRRTIGGGEFEPGKPTVVEFVPGAR